MPLNLKELDLFPLGDQALSIRFGTVIQEENHREIQSFMHYIEKHPIHGIEDIIPAFTTLTFTYDPMKLAKQMGETSSPFLNLKKQLLMRIEAYNATSSETHTLRQRTIPVCYGGTFGPDLAYVATYHHLSIEEVISLHSETEYLVYMIGFAPGFPYMGGLSEKLHTPRRSTPRLRLPKGSVGIADGQTGVYPLETPGGWQLIGRTPLSLFNPESAAQPSFLQSGDRIRFIPISEKDFWRYAEGGAQWE